MTHKTSGLGKHLNRCLGLHWTLPRRATLDKKEEHGSTLGLASDPLPPWQISQEVPAASLVGFSGVCDRLRLAFFSWLLLLMKNLTKKLVSHS